MVFCLLNMRYPSVKIDTLQHYVCIDKKKAIHYNQTFNI